jgi:aminopeptidase N
MRIEFMILIQSNKHQSMIGMASLGAFILVLMIAFTGCQTVPVQLPTPTAEHTSTIEATTTIEVTATTQPVTLLPQTSTAPAAPPLSIEVGIAGERSIGDPYIPELGNTGYDVQHYTLRLVLDPAHVYVDAHVTIEALTTDEDIAQISLDFVGYEIEELSLNGEPTAFTRAERKLVVEFAEPLPAGEAFTLDVIYRGQPVFETSPYVPFISHLGLQFPETEENGSVYAVSEPDGARYWFPCNDHPRDKAEFRFQLGVPEGLAGAANGILLESRLGVPAVFEDGSAGDVYIWEHNYPMATYLATVVVGEYERVEGVSPGGIPLRHYVFPDQVNAFEAQEATIGSMLNWMGELFGAYPFEVFGFAAVDGLGASLETQTLVILDRNAGEYIMAHEVAHMWFGNWVSLHSWGDMWRNEGFSTYFGTLWSLRSDPAAFDQYMNDLADSYRDYVPQYPLNQPPPRALFGRDSYMRGALLVHELRALMGDEAFFDGLRLYFTRFGGGTATHDQFQSIMEEAGGIDLEDFFEAWFRG